MRYEIGDYVIPCDLPRRWICRVVEVERRALAGGDGIQILTLAPLAGPWRPGTLLVRLDGSVRPTGGGARSRSAVGRAAAAARRALDRKPPPTRGKVIQLPVRPKRLPVPPRADVGDVGE